VDDRYGYGIDYQAGQTPKYQQRPTAAQRRLIILRQTLAWLSQCRCGPGRLPADQLLLQAAIVKLERHDDTDTDHQCRHNYYQAA